MATLAELVFEEYPDDVITVRLSPVPMREYFGLMREFDALDAPAPNGESALQRVVDFFDHWARVALVSWTFPWETTGEGMMNLDMGLASAVVRQWMNRIGEVPAPLLVGSTGGERSPGPLTQTPANRSQRRQSSRTRK